MVLFDGGARNSAQQSLLHTTFESEDSDLGGWKLNMDGYLADKSPGQGGKEGHDKCEPKCLGEEDPLSGKDITVSSRVPEVPEDCEHPSCDNTSPTNESMEPLEYAISHCQQLKVQSNQRTNL